LKPDESRKSPVSSPGVSDDPVTSLVARVTSKLDGVIDGETTLVSSENTTGVVLPLRSIAADGERHLSKSLVDGSLVRRNRGDLGHGELLGRTAVAGLAVLVLGGVRVAAVSVLTTLLLNP